MTDATASWATELVERIRRHDEAAETELFRRFAARIAFLGRRDLRVPAGADDVCSETMLRVIQAVRAGRLRQAEALPGFVLQTTRFVIIEFNRKEQRFVSIDAPDSGVPEAEAATPDPLPDRGEIRALKLAASQLNARDRAFLRLESYDELPRREIAIRLGVTEDRVRLIRSRALQRFREAYDTVTRTGDTK